jgi:hypothetical protein
MKIQGSIIKNAYGYGYEVYINCMRNVCVAYGINTYEEAEQILKQLHLTDNLKNSNNELVKGNK